MKVKNLFAKVLLGLTLAASFVIFANAPTVASGVRDYNSNAIIYGGSYSVTELTNQLNKGTGHPNQSAAQLKDLFAKNGIYTKDFGQLKNGVVTKSGNVIVGGKVVATGVTTMGREYMAGSTKDTRFSYPIYLRHPSVSFRSNSLEAFVSMNYDGSYAYAVLKPCGNIVKGPGVKAKPVTYKAYALKWIDANGNGKWDKDENVRQANVPFTIKGNGVGTTVRTDSNGYAYFKNLKPGTYTITETVPAGYKSTTGSVKTLSVSKDNQGVTFGNQKIEAPKYKLIVRKFEDINGNTKKDQGENFLAGWQYTVSGPNGFSKTITTGNDGSATLTDLVAGSYTVSEILKPDWKVTNGQTRTFNLNTTTEQWFGNQKIIKPEKVSLTVRKFNDLDGDKVQDSNEGMLSGWSFNVVGPNGFSKTITTGSNGTASLTNLVPGTYTATEILKSGWTNTTGLTVTQNVTKEAKTQTFTFGNKENEKPKPGKVSLSVRKFNDLDGDKVQDSNEGMLSGWSFDVVGPNGFSKTITTGADGTASLNDLEPGTYTITEVLKEGWVNTTGITLTHEIKKEDKTFSFIFGNQEIVTPPTPVTPEVPSVVEQGKGEPLPTSGPVEAAAGAMGTVAIGGASFGWLKSKKTLLSALKKIK